MRAQQLRVLSRPLACRPNCGGARGVTVLPRRPKSTTSQEPHHPSSQQAHDEKVAQPPSVVRDEKAAAQAVKAKKKTLADLDEEMRLKMEGISGDGGASGVEYENGKAEGLKRGVKSNMFRVI